jgi:hypothetical protein
MGFDRGFEAEFLKYLWLIFRAMRIRLTGRLGFVPKMFKEGMCSQTFG